MEYPKEIMSMKELMKMGFPESTLRKAHTEALITKQTWAFKQNVSARNSPILFYTPGFEKWRVRQVNAERAAMSRICVI